MRNLTIHEPRSPKECDHLFILFFSLSRTVRKARGAVEGLPILHLPNEVEFLVYVCGLSWKVDCFFVLKQRNSSKQNKSINGIVLSFRRKERESQHKPLVNSGAYYQHNHQNPPSHSECHSSTQKALTFPFFVSPRASLLMLTHEFTDWAQTPPFPTVFH